MDMFQWRKLALRCLYLSMITIVIAIAAYNYPMVATGMGIVGIILFILYVGISFKYWKCPNCKEQFPVVYSRMDERTECWHCLASLK
ncbi:MAG: hypothetical protein ACRDA4_04105 [Filifactoraceae bacterium]